MADSPEVASYGTKALVVLAAAAAGRALRHFDKPPREIDWRRAPVVFIWELIITGACAFLGHAGAGAMGLSNFSEILFIGLLARGGPTLLDEVMRRITPTFTSSNNPPTRRTDGE